MHYVCIFFSLSLSRAINSRPSSQLYKVVPYVDMYYMQASANVHIHIFTHWITLVYVFFVSYMRIDNIYAHNVRQLHEPILRVILSQDARLPGC